jgi:DNA-binding NarL/FixJ family response regulator
MSEAIRLIIVDDHAVVRQGLKAFLATEEDIELLGEASNGREAVDLTAKLSPDVVLMDLVMPRRYGGNKAEHAAGRGPRNDVVHRG